MIYAGHDFAAPRRRDKAGWTAVAVVLTAGLKYNGFVACGCSKEPKFRPRTKAQVRARLRIAERTGIDRATALAARDPYSLQSEASEASVPAESQVGQRASS
jgi:hypothetical protein